MSLYHMRARIWTFGVRARSPDRRTKPVHFSRSRSHRYVRRTDGAALPVDADLLHLLAQDAEMDERELVQALTTSVLKDLVPYSPGLGTGFDLVGLCRVRARWQVEDAIRRGVLAARSEPARSQVSREATLKVGNGWSLPRWLSVWVRFR